MNTLYEINKIACNYAFLPKKNRRDHNYYRIEMERLIPTEYISLVNPFFGEKRCKVVRSDFQRCNHIFGNLHNHSYNYANFLIYDKDLVKSVEENLPKISDPLGFLISLSLDMISIQERSFVRRVTPKFCELYLAYSIHTS